MKNGVDKEMRQPFLFLCIVALVCMTVLVVPAMAANETFPADVDAYIRSGGQADTNYGSIASLYIREESTGTLYRSLIHFDLSSIPAGATIESATLYGYQVARSGDREVAAYRVTDTWNESGVTWNTHPSIAAQPTDVIDPGSEVNAWINWNVTQDVQAYVNGTANYGWMLNFTNESTPSTSQKVQMRSREYATDTTQQPSLNVIYTVPPPVLTTIEVSPATANVAVNATQQFNANAKDQNGDEMTGISFTWTSSNETVGTVNATGYFTALAAGATTVTAAAENVTGTAQVTAIAPTCDLTIPKLPVPYPGAAVFAKEPNVVRVVVLNNGPETATNISVAVYASDVSNGTVPVNTTIDAIASLASGAQTNVKLIDPTIRNLQGGNVTYTAVIDPDNTIAESDETNNVKVGMTKDVLYNGYKGKALYWEGGTNITTKRTYDLRGGLVYSFGNSSYRSGSFSTSAGPWLNYTVGWTADNISIPDNAQVVEARLYVPYTWDYGDQAPDNVSVDFNGVRVPYEYWDSDTSNFGMFADYKYGLLSYNVTDEFLKNEENTVFFSRTISNAKISMYGFTLAVVYADPNETRKQIFLDEGFDLLGASTQDYGATPEEATAYVEFSGMSIDPAEVANATLITFAPSAAGWEGVPAEGALIVNGQTLQYYVWDYSGGAGGSVGEGGGGQVAVDTRDIKDYLLSEGNVIGIQSYPDTPSPCMAASQQFLVVEYPDPTYPDLTVSTLASNNGEVFSHSNNTYTAKVTNIGEANATAFAVGFNVSGVISSVSVPDGLAAGANTTVTWTDETIRTAGTNVTITATADVDGAIIESNEENNVKSIEKTVANNGYRGKRWTGGDDLTAAKTYENVRGDLVYSSGDSVYLSASTYPHWTTDTVNWTAADLSIPENATITAARLYVPYTWDKGPVFPDNVVLTFNNTAIERTAYYEDEKMWGSSYPYGMSVYDVTDSFNKDGNTAVLTSTYPGGGNVSVRGMLLAVVYDDGVTAPHTVLMNEGFDLLYGGASQGSTPEQATAYAPFGTVESGTTGARLITVAPGAGPTEGDLLFNGNEWNDVWNYTGSSQIGVDERNVTALLSAGSNTAGIRSSGDYMEAAAAFLVVEYPVPTGSISVASTPTGAAIYLDGTDTGETTPATLDDVATGGHVVTLTMNSYINTSTPVTVAEGQTATVDLTFTTQAGSIAVTSTPAGAAIFVDGAATGKTTNSTVAVVAVGEHTVTLEKDGYRTAAANVTIRYNETTSLHLDLVEAVGSIAVTSSPDGAAIYLDGTATGQTTNATLENVPAGEYEITLKLDDYADAAKNVTVVDNATVTAAFTLVQPTGSIRVTSSPDGARIFLDGKDTGEQTNTTLEHVPLGEHTITLTLDNYLDAEESVTVAEDETANVHVDLSNAEITLHPGWNFVSTPLTLAAGADTIALFDGVDTAGHSVLLYNGTGGWEAMSSQESFEPLDGIWIYANGTYTIPLTFAADTQDTPPVKDLDEGWNAIGFSDTVPEPAADTLVSVNEAWTTLFGFDAEAQAYDASIIHGATDNRHGDDRLMNPMQGYWIFMNEPDTLSAIGA